MEKVGLFEPNQNQKQNWRNQCDVMCLLLSQAIIHKQQP